MPVMWLRLRPVMYKWASTCPGTLPSVLLYFVIRKQKGLAAASIVQDDRSTLPGNDPFPCTRMYRNRNAW